MRAKLKLLVRQRAKYCLSPTGRATVKRLDLNRQSLINFRSAFRILGLHPPQ